MKLARFANESGNVDWTVIVRDEAFDFELIQPGNVVELSTDNSPVQELLRRQPLRLAILDQMRRSNRLAGQVELLSGLDCEEFVGRRQPLSQLENKWLPPIEATSFRDFYAFEGHVRAARKRRGLEMVPEWYDAPAFYFSNTASIVGHLAPIEKPGDTNELDYELEIAIVVGRDGKDITVDEADDYIAGYTILNDWSARDIQRREMKVGLGPAKGKDFATSIGPYLVTPDELEDRVLADTSRGKRYDLEMTAFVNGRQYSKGNASTMHWTFAELIAQASRNTMLRSGDLIGSGTVGTGCITEFAEGVFPWLESGDVVRLEIERLGALENRVV